MFMVSACIAGVHCLFLFGFERPYEPSLRLILMLFFFPVSHLSNASCLGHAGMSIVRLKMYTKCVLGSCMQAIYTQRKKEYASGSSFGLVLLWMQPNITNPIHFEGFARAESAVDSPPIYIRGLPVRLLKRRVNITSFLFTACQARHKIAKDPELNRIIALDTLNSI